MSTFRPILASPVEDVTKLRFPVLVSPKLDGVRCLIINGKPVTRNLKGIRNAHIFKALSGLPDFDGELIVGDPTASDVFNTSVSAVMRGDREPDFTYYVFDLHNYNRLGGPFISRLDTARGMVSLRQHPHVVMLPHNEVGSPEELMTYEQAFVEAGYEGVMIRDPQGHYKHGRSTFKEGILLKLKRFEDAEALVTGVTERMHNANTAMVNALGLTERSSHKSNLVGAGDMGALVCTWRDGIEFEIGTGFTAAQRKEIWDLWHQRTASSPPVFAKFKYQQVTPDGVPRFPVFIGFRAVEDMS